MSRSEQDYEELEIYLQQAKEEIGLALDQDRHRKDEVNVAASRIQSATSLISSTTEKSLDRSSGTRDVQIIEKNSSFVEQFEKTATTLQVSYDVTFKHDVTLEHEVVIAEGDTFGQKPKIRNKSEFAFNENSEFEQNDKYEIKLQESGTKEFEDTGVSSCSDKFFDTEQGSTNSSFDVGRIPVPKRDFEQLDHRIESHHYQSYQEVTDSSITQEAPSGVNSFEHVVLKIKDFLSEKFKDDDSKSDADSSDEYLTAETDFDSLTKYSGKNERARFTKNQSRTGIIGYQSSSENDSYLSDVSNLESDFSDCKSLTSEEFKTAFKGLLDSRQVAASNELENQFLQSYEKETLTTETTSGSNQISKLNHGYFEHLENFERETTTKTSTESVSSLASIENFRENVGLIEEKNSDLIKPVTTFKLPTKLEESLISDNKNSYHLDIEKSLQSELDDFNLQLNEVENNINTNSLHIVDRPKNSILRDLDPIHAEDCHKNVCEEKDSFTGLEDVENLLKRSLLELHRSLSEPTEHEKLAYENEKISESSFAYLTKDLLQFIKHDIESKGKHENGNKHFAILGINSIPAVGENGRKKGRSLSVPEITVSNWKSFPENEDNIPTEMVVGPYASMSNSYNENWNSSVFMEQNTVLKEKLLTDHQNNSKEELFHPQTSTDIVSLSREKGPQKSFRNAKPDILSTDLSKYQHNFQSLETCTQTVEDGQVLVPPPEFSDAANMSKSDFSHHDPSQDDLDPPAIPESLDRKERVTLDRKMKHPVTPPPPSVGSTEILISDTLSQHRKLSSGSNDLNDSQSFRKNENFRRKSADSALVTENGLDAVLNLKLNRKSGSAIEDLRKDGAVHEAFRKNTDDSNKENISDLGPALIEIDKQEKNKQLIPTKYSVLNAEFKEASKREKGLCNGVHIPKYATIATNTSDSLKRLPKIQINAPSFSEDTVSLNKINSGKNDSSSLCNGVQTDVDKTTHSNDNVHSDKGLETEEKKPLMRSLEYDISPEMQVMINSLSPVLLRRNSTKTKKSARKVGSDSSESSPEIEKKAHLNKKQTALEPYLYVADKTRNVSAEEKSSESLFMDPKMSQTWHGATSANWSQIYGPQMREMMRQLNGENLDDTDAGDADRNFTEGSKTLPSSKSLLDEMHKKFCADQYNHNLSDTEMAKALVLLRLKSNKPSVLDKLRVSNAKRSASFHIKMGTGASSSSESSPLLPRFSERRHIKTSPRIKTSPNMQFPNRPRGKTPEPLVLSKRLEQTAGPSKEEAEIEAVEACRWLKETGFPQYAQMYEDGQFPVDIDSVEKDHDFLDKEDIQSLFRRLNTLNKCAIMKIGTPTKKESEDSEDEDQCALSDKWKYTRSSRRWSRKDLNSPVIKNINGETTLKSASSHDSLLADQNSSSETGDSPVLDSKMHHTTTDDMMLNRKHLMVDANGNATMKLSPKIRRAASERIKSAKSFLKRVESLKGRRRKPKHISDISGPVVTDNADMQAKIKHLNCKDIHTTSKTETLDTTTAESRLQPNLDTSANSSKLSSPEKSATFSSPGSESLTMSSLDRTGDSSVFLSTNTTFSDSDTTNSVNTSPNGALGFTPLSRQKQRDSASSDNAFLPVDYKPGKFPKVLDESIFSTSDSNARTRSFSYIDDSSEHNSDIVRRRGSCDPRHQLHRISIYDNVPIEEDLSVAQQELDIILSELFQNINGLNRAINGEDAELLHPPSFSEHDNSNISIDADGNDSEHALDTHSDTRDNEVISGTLSSPDISDHELHTEDLSHDDSAEHIECRERRDSGVGSSLTRTNSDRRRYRIRWHSFQKSHRPNSVNRNLQLCNLSAGQILILRKLSLLKLTALLEKYSPNRSGWSLTVPRFMKRNKVPDYKDKNVFGVPFSVMIQRTGQALPQCVLHAMRFLRRNARDALGIFRKSGVRSRIQKLRNEIEANPENTDFDELQAYDVADLVKQYFRELPECLLTNKLSDIFISIFIYVPAEMRLEAMQAAIVLMVDENRDVLQSLLLFLSDISQYASEHQMTASNLAVCFGPSLFNMGGFRHPNQTPSPRRNRKNPGIPDARELMEQKAAHECLTLMIQECKKLFTIPAGTISKCRCWHGDPVSLDELNQGTGEGDNQGYTSYIDSCIQGLLKESRDKFRGWVSVPVSSDVDVSYKKVGDGHPLRLWKCTVDVEAPPSEVLNRVLNERQVWDEDLLQWNTIEKLDKQTEVFQFVRNSLAPHPTRDFCVLRSWRSDLPKGACVLISTSIDHPRAELLGGIRAVELASRYLIEPCGTGKSRLTHISRVDIRGHSPDWYKKVYGHVCANFMRKVRSSFQQSTGGPETKV